MQKDMRKVQRQGKILVLLFLALALLWPAMKRGLAQGETLADIGPDQPRSAAPCDQTLDPGANIQDAIDAVRDKESAYVL